MLEEFKAERLSKFRQAVKERSQIIRWQGSRQRRQGFTLQYKPLLWGGKLSHYVVYVQQGSDPFAVVSAHLGEKDAIEMLCAADAVLTAFLRRGWTPSLCFQAPHSLLFKAELELLLPAPERLEFDGDDPLGAFCDAKVKTVVQKCLRAMI